MTKEEQALHDTIRLVSELKTIKRFVITDNEPHGKEVMTTLDHAITEFPSIIVNLIRPVKSKRKKKPLTE